MVSPTYISALVIILGVILPRVGVTVGSEDLTTLITAGLTLIAGIVILYRKYKEGNVNILGFKKLG